MKKKVFGRKFSRDSKSRAALFRSLVKAMVERGKIVTTKAKAKAVQPAIEKLVSSSKTKDVSVIRRMFTYLGNDTKTVRSLFDTVAESFKNKKGGYTRIVNLPRRKGDNAEMARLEWTEKVEMRDEKLVESKNKKNSKKKETTKTDQKTTKPSLKSKVTGLLKSKNK